MSDLKDKVGGAGAKNDEADVKVVQDLLNKAVIDGGLPGFQALLVDGKVSPVMLKMIHSYQARNGLLPSKKTKPEEVTVEPGKNTLKHLVANPLVDPAWSKYDKELKTDVKGYNDRFAGVAAFQTLDWRWVKAMLWQETGAKTSEWNSKPLQIGNPGDPGLKVVKGESSGTERSKVKAVVSSDLQGRLKREKMSASLNIEAGIAYLFFRCAEPKLKYATVDDDPATLTYTLHKGEFPSSIAGKLKTTTGIIMKDSGLTSESVKKLHPDAVIHYHLGHEEWQVGGWTDWPTAIHNYNGGGVKGYFDAVKARYDKITQIFAQ